MTCAVPAAVPPPASPRPASAAQCGPRPPAAARAQLQAALPAGVLVEVPEAAADQAANLSRAYRVNLTMLAAIALLTGGLSGRLRNLYRALIFVPMIVAPMGAISSKHRANGR